LYHSEQKEEEEEEEEEEANNGLHLRKVIPTIHIVINNNSSLSPQTTQLSSSESHDRLPRKDLDNTIAACTDD
jgi:hypothetical protein